jgi:hypothetical protein
VGASGFGCLRRRFPPLGKSIGLFGVVNRPAECSRLLYGQMAGIPDDFKLRSTLMESRHHIDPVRVLEEVFYTLLHRLFHNEGARNRFGFYQINGFASGNGLPGWNLWFDGCEGAYQIILSDSESAVTNSEHECDRVTGRWDIRYFPGEGEASLETFSTIEMMARWGPLFDPTGTPTHVGQSQLNADLFLVGYIDVCVSVDRSFIEISIRSQNRLCEIRSDGLRLDVNDPESITLVNPGAKDREVAGWDLSHFIYNKLLCALCHAYHTRPAFVIKAEQDGVYSEIDTDGMKRLIVDPGNLEYLLLAGFSLLCDGQASDDRGPMEIETVHQRLIKNDWQITETYQSQPAKTAANVNANWWKIKDLNFREGCSTHTHLCCYADH